NGNPTTSTNFYGSDYIAGGAGNDFILGQLGDDVIQGDGSIDIAVRATTSSIDDFAGAGTDGDDNIEGNGGNDLILGYPGQEDLIAGRSSLFGFDSAAKRPDGKDIIFGGSGTHTARNDLGDTSAAGHARDADFILGDNGNIYRLVGVNGV